MKKKPKKQHHGHKGRRNAATTSAPSAPRSRTSREAGRRGPPPWKTILSAVAGGGVGAALGGLVVHQGLLSDETVGLGLMLGGGAAAYFADGNTRVVGTSVAAAGAGQFALAVMTKHAAKKVGESKGTTQHQEQPQQPAPQLQLAAPPPAVAPPRKSATGGGVVLDLFRDAVTDLDSIEDEWRYGMREAASAPDPIVIDLDQAA